MTTRDANVEIVRSFVDAIDSDGFEAARRFLSDDYVWWSPGGGEVQHLILAS